MRGTVMNALAVRVASALRALGAGESWLARLARLGYGARGTIYLLIGWFALRSATGWGGRTVDSKGAIMSVLSAPGGWIMVLAIALGLLGYSGWRLCQGALDADSLGRDSRALASRTGMIVSGITHFMLACWAGSVALGLVSGGEWGTNRSLVAMLLAKPFGSWLVGIAGATLAGVGIAQFHKGHNESFERRFCWRSDERRKLILFCKFGLYARGVVFAIIGWFVIYAAVTTNPNEAGGLRDALQWLSTQPYGAWLLGIVALGLMSFGVFSIIEARYRRLEPPVVNL
jgi:hypothetical protein